MSNWICFVLLAIAALGSDWTGDFVNTNEGVKEGANTPASSELVQHTAAIIKEFEGCVEKPYWDVNAWRAGCGSDTTTLEDGTVVAITPESTVTMEQAERDLKRRIADDFLAVIQKQTTRFNQYPINTKSALISLAYNYGSLPDPVVQAVESGDVAGIANAVESLHTQDNGINSHRRKAEAELIRKDL